MEEGRGDDRRSAGPGRGRPTMTDVAAAAGVSQTTVSLVLSGAAGARLAAGTRDRVVVAAAALGYERQPRPTAAALQAEAGTIGVLFDEMSPDPWCALALDGVRARAWEHGVTVLTAVTGGDRDLEAAALARLGALPLLGLIYGRIHTTEVEPPEALRRHRAVLLNCYAADRSLPSIVPGEVAAGHAATDRLLRAGHRRIGFINGEAWMDAARDRLKGYRQSLATADLPFDPDLVRVGNWQPSSGYGCTLDLMRAEAPTAIFCANDLMALGCIAALRELGLRVPEDVSVMGFDDREIAQHTLPPLTTMLLPHADMGARAADLLIEPAGQGGGRGGRIPHIKVECPPVERQSVGAMWGRGDEAETERAPVSRLRKIAE
jgi:LacI family transcriptional regulator